MRHVFKVHVANDTTRTDLTFDIYATLTFNDLCSGKFLRCLIQKLTFDIQTDGLISVSMTVVFFSLELWQIFLF